MILLVDPPEKNEVKTKYHNSFHEHNMELQEINSKLKPCVTSILFC